MEKDDIIEKLKEKDDTIEKLKKKITILGTILFVVAMVFLFILIEMYFPDINQTTPY